jgi:hypothetical protein
MDVNLPIPFWILRRIVRRNRWLLSDTGDVNRNVVIDLGLFEFEMTGTMTLLPKQREKLLAEHEAGTLLPNH